MVVGTTTRGCQTVVIGGGPGGYLAAIRLAQLKQDVLLVDENPALGGICLNEGCIPSKALIHAADLLEEAKSASKMGIRIDGAAVDLPKVMEWKDGIVRKLTDGVRMLATRNGAEILTGQARFVGDRRLEVFTETGPVLVDFEKAVIATGSRAKTLEGFEFDGEHVIGSREALSLRSIPKRLVIIGGGYIALELGSVYRRFGSEVDILVRADSLLAFHDPEVGKTIARRMKELGVRLHFGHCPIRIERGEVSKVTIACPDSSEKIMEADGVMVSIGRVPNSDRLDLEKAGVKINGEGFIPVDSRMETNVPGIFAVGDVVGGPLLAHKAYREAKVAAEVIAGNPAGFDNLVIPAVVYTDPEIAWAGLSEKEARGKGYQVVTGNFPFRASGRAMTLNAVEGFVKTIADAETLRILGVTIVGADASELISEAALAIEMGARLDDLSQTIHPHPTLSEGLLESVGAALGEAIHIMNR